MTKYRKKPVVIEARQHHGTQETGDEIIEWTKGSKTPAYWDTEIRNCSDSHPEGFAYPVLKITTLEGDHTVSPMDQVIEGIAGEFYPCKPDIFEALYVEETEDNGARPWEIERI